MQNRLKKTGVIVGLLTGSGYLLSGPATSCTSFTGRSALVSADFCFIFDCQNGIIGGTFDPCGGIGSGDATVEGNTALPVFTDCPTNVGP